MTLASTLRLPFGRSHATAEPAVAPQASATAESPSLFRRIFNDKPEHSLRLRALALLIALWAAFAVIAVGVEPLVPLAAAAGIIAGHGLSWNRRMKRTPTSSTGEMSRDLMSCANLVADK